MLFGGVFPRPKRKTFSSELKKYFLRRAVNIPPNKRKAVSLIVTRRVANFTISQFYFTTPYYSFFILYIWTYSYKYVYLHQQNNI